MVHFQSNGRPLEDNRSVNHVIRRARTRLLRFDRLLHALELAEKAAFAPEGFLRWLNAVRPAGAATHAEVPLTVVGVAAATAEAFRQRVEWWGG
jgi:hypothetical protein